MRTLIEGFDAEFTAVEERLRSLLEMTSDPLLFAKPFNDEKTLVEHSVGGFVIRAAAMIEQAFLGITRRLWDDPFEWTLPEELSTRDAIRKYIDEVTETRMTGMAFLASDADLTRQLPAPEKLRTIFAVLVDALLRAENLRGKAETLLHVVNGP
jgi:hypothetical protein